MTHPFTEPAGGIGTSNGSIRGRHGPIPIRRYRSLSGYNSDLDPLIWLHGGAFSHGGLDQLESHAVACAIAFTGRGVVAVDYRLVPPWSWIREPKPGKLPGIRYPVPLEDVLDAVSSVMDDAAPGVVLGGASAGACLAAAATLRLRDEGLGGPTRLILAYGTFHAELPPVSPEVRSRVRSHYGLTQFRSQTVEKMNRNYAGSPEAMCDPHAFPGGADLTGFPPSLILDAYWDTLRVSGEAFACELRRAGVPVEHAVVRARHGFLNRPGTKAFSVGIEQLGLWLQRTETRGQTER